MSLLSSLLLPAFQFINSVVVCSFSFRFRVCARRSPSTSGFNAFPRTFSLDVIYTLLTERQVSAGRCGSVFNKPPVGTYTNIFPLCVRNAPLVSTLFLPKMFGGCSVCICAAMCMWFTNFISCAMVCYCIRLIFPHIHALDVQVHVIPLLCVSVWKLMPALSIL